VAFVRVFMGIFNDSFFGKKRTETYHVSSLVYWLCLLGIAADLGEF
jgi:hypothetical protein